MNANIIGNYQLWIWFLTLFESVLGLYILALNFRHSANRHVSGCLLLIAANTFAFGTILNTGVTLLQSGPGWTLFALTTLAVPPLVFLTTVILIKPTWFKSRLRWLLRLGYILIVLPAISILVDQELSSLSWFSPFDTRIFNLQSISSGVFSQGTIAPYLFLLNLFVLPLLIISLSMFIALFDRNATIANRKLAWFIFVAGSITTLIRMFLYPYLIPIVGFVVPGLIWTLTFAFAAFQQMISERHSQTGTLQGRLTALILIVTIPLLISTNLVVTKKAADLLDQSILEDIKSVHQSFVTTLEYTDNPPKMIFDLLNNRAQNFPLGDKGIVYVVNDQNQVMVHSDPQLPDLRIDFSDYAPIKYVREDMTANFKDAGRDLTAQSEMFTFMDDDGTEWRAVASVLKDDWAVFVQIPENEIGVVSSILNNFSLSALSIGAILILVLSMFTIRQGLYPIKDITETASAIASGDLTRIAPINSEGEFGILAGAFNSMTNQLRELIANLERRVSDRTRDIEKHALQLQVAAQVANEAAAIRDMEQLLNHTVYLISERFDFYHAGIFLIDDTGKYAVLRAASSDGGRRMFERGHKLEVGEEGIVGYVAGKGEPRIALDVGEDDRYFDNPDMPRTRSEMALPLVVHQEVIGVLDVQSTKPSAFTQDDINVLQILADQVALALDNARLLAESMQAFNKLEKVYKQETKLAWNERLANQKITYSYNQFGIQKDAPSPLSSISENDDPYILKLPLSFRGLSLGSITLRRSNDQPPWSIDDVQMVKTTVSQIVLALENARLMDEIRRNAQQEEALNKISASAHSSLDLETVMKKAVKDIGQALGAQKVQIRLSNTDRSSERTLEPDQVQTLES